MGTEETLKISTWEPPWGNLRTFFDFLARKCSRTQPQAQNFPALKKRIPSPSHLLLINSVRPYCSPLNLSYFKNFFLKTPQPEVEGVVPVCCSRSSKTASVASSSFSAASSMLVSTLYKYSSSSSSSASLLSSLSSSLGLCLVLYHHHHHQMKKKPSKTLSLHRSR